MLRDVMKGAVIAGTVCSLFATGAARAAEKPKKEGASVVKCAGINECKGKGACAGADNACKSKNSCKGQGWMETKSAQECKDKGGKVLASM